jgi:ribosomal protein S6
LKNYEALVIFPSRIRDEELTSAIAHIEEDIVKANGTIVGHKVMGKRTFSRPLKKEDSGIYTWIGFQLDPLAIDGLKKRTALNDQVFRMQVLVAEESRMTKYAPKADAAPAEAKA